MLFVWFVLQNKVLVWSSYNNDTDKTRLVRVGGVNWTNYRHKGTIVWVKQSDAYSAALKRMKLTLAEIRVYT